jgi:hypothetical protein
MADLSDTFVALREIMLPFAKSLQRVADTDSHLYLNTQHLQENKKPLFFGAVQLKKGGVSYHLMPLYTHPQLLSSVSPELKKKMQGKSCFTLTRTDDALLKDLAELTKAAFEAYRKAGYV